MPGRTDNEIKNYWRTRVQKHAKQLKCDVNSKQFKDTMRYLWMPRLVERIQAAAATATNTSSTSTATVSAPATNQHLISNRDVGTGNLVMAPHGINGNDFGVSHVTQSYTPENSSTAASSDSFATQVSPVSDLTTDYYNIPVNRNTNPDYFQAGQVGYSESMISPPGFFNHGLDFQAMEHSSNQWPMDSGDTSDNMWNLEDIWFLQQQLNNLWKGKIIWVRAKVKMQRNTRSWGLV